MSTGQGMMRLASPRSWNASAQPRRALLMLSHCVPDAGGDAARQRAWELLQHATQSHDVYLAAVAEAKVNLQQWRALHACTAALSLESSGPLRKRFGRALDAVVTRWREQVTFDAVICTRAELLQRATRLSARVTVCAEATTHRQGEDTPVTVVLNDFDALLRVLRQGDRADEVAPLRRAA